MTPLYTPTKFYQTILFRDRKNDMDANKRYQKHNLIKVCLALYCYFFIFYGYSDFYCDFFSIPVFAVMRSPKSLGIIIIISGLHK